MLAHVLDFDDLHMESTVARQRGVRSRGARGRRRRARLPGGRRASWPASACALGWPHYAAGWHATCTAGAPAAAAGGGGRAGPRRRRGRHGHGARGARGRRRPARVRHGRQGAAGRASRSQAGVRAARLAAAGASADPRALDQWLALVGGDAERLALDGPAVPGGLAVKLFPCCYALQRPIAALRALDVDPDAGRARGGAHAARARSPRSSTPRRRPAWRASSACSTRSPPPCSTAARDRELHRRGRRPARGAGAARARGGRRHAGRRLAAGRRRRDRAHAGRRLDAARPARPPARRARPPAVAGRAGREGGRLRGRPGRRGPRGRLGRRRARSCASGCRRAALPRS